MSAAEQAVAAIIARDGLQLTEQDHARLVTLYEELQPELAELHAPEFAGEEPAVIFDANA
jgi:hypothetical protein